MKKIIIMYYSTNNSKMFKFESSLCARMWGWIQCWIQSWREIIVMDRLLKHCLEFFGAFSWLAFLYIIFIFSLQLHIDQHILIPKWQNRSFANDSKNDMQHMTNGDYQWHTRPLLIFHFTQDKSSCLLGQWTMSCVWLIYRPRLPPIFVCFVGTWLPPLLRSLPQLSKVVT